MHPPGGPPPVRVSTATVKLLQPLASLHAVGTLRAVDAVTLRAEAAGRIERFGYEDGQFVEAGSLVVVLDSTTASAELMEAQANFESSRRLADRARHLSSLQYISAADVDAAESALGVAGAKFHAAQAAYRRTQLRAPFGGTTGLRKISVGEYVQPGQEVMEIVNLGSMHVDFQLPETELSEVAVGQPIVVSVDAYPKERFSGAVSAISPSIGDAGRSISIRAKVPNPAGKLRPGQFARVDLASPEASRKLAVPEAALWIEDKRQVVFRVVGGGVEVVPVVVGSRWPGHVHIRSGLEVGDVVVTAGQQKLRGGSKVVGEGVANDKQAASSAGSL